MLTFKPLQTGDTIALVAPAAAGFREKLPQVCELLKQWGFNVSVSPHIFGNTAIYANEDSLRWAQLYQALCDPDIAAVWCWRGGYGTTRLIPQLMQCAKPAQAKPVLGFSDITALHIFLQQIWQWPAIHCYVASQLVSSHVRHEERRVLQQLLRGEPATLTFNNLSVYNSAACQQRLLQGRLIGGNLSLLQTTLGTALHVNTTDKIIFLEETNERAYRIDRMLTHLTQADVFTHAQAIILGDFVDGNEANGHNHVNEILQNFAASLPIPVIQCRGIGHGYPNYPLPLGTLAQLQLGHSCHLNVANPFNANVA